MKILIDTNIIIQLEDNIVLGESFTKFLQLAHSNNCSVFYHPDCEKDIQKDSDSVRKEITLSKLKKYAVFPNAGIPDKQFLEKVGEKKDNDKIDNKQLYQAYLKYTDLFITEDQGIHKKASLLGIENVIGIKQAVELLIEKFTFRIPQHPLLEHLSLREIEHSLKTNFFDSLRNDYNGFDNWFVTSAQKDRKCYTFKSNDEIQALLIYKEEKAADHRIEGVFDDALKMCTLKVAETAFGYKIGELFLSKMFALCIEKKIPYLYLTVFEKQEQLINLLISFGFKGKSFKNKNGKEELIYIKPLDKLKLLEEESDTKTIHPFYHDNNDVDKYVIPIQDKYYKTLFKDGGLRQNQLFDKDESSLNEIQGNTIKKAYICASPRKLMKEGSILLFYSSAKKRVIEPLGILESLHRVNSYEELKSLVSKRTVFSDADLEQMLKERKELTVLLFRLSYYLPKPVSFKVINMLSCFSNKFTTITSLKEGDYNLLKSKNYFDERYIIN